MSWRNYRDESTLCGIRLSGADLWVAIIVVTSMAIKLMSIVMRTDSKLQVYTENEIYSMKI